MNIFVQERMVAAQYYFFGIGNQDDIIISTFLDYLLINQPMSMTDQ